MRFRLGVSVSGALLAAASCTGGGGGGGGSKPAIPANVSAMVAGTDIQLNWTASAGASSYNVYYALDPGVVRSNATKLGSVSTAGAIVTGQPSAIGYFAITAKNGNGESALSAEVTASVPAAGLDPLFG